MIVTRKHPEDQACKAGGQYYGHNIPFPADHSDECNEANEDAEKSGDKPKSIMERANE
jgi:hypothetical protein